MAIVFIDDARKDEYLTFFTALQSKVDIITLDTETNGLDPHTSRMLLLQVGIKDDVFVFDVARLGTDLIKTVVKSLILTKATFIAHNAKFDIKLIKKETDYLITRAHDTMTTEVLINAGVGDTLYSLATLVEKYCKVTLDKDTRKEFIDFPFGKEFTANQILYAGTDVLYLEHIYKRQLFEVIRTNMQKVYTEEMRLIPVVAMMEYVGIKIDPQRWIELEKKALAEAEPHRKAIIDLVIDSIDFSKVENGLALADMLKITEGTKTKKDRFALESISDPLAVKEWARENFNIQSNKQLLNAVNMLGVETDSTNEKVLNKLPKTPIITEIMAFREQNKLASTYGSNIADLINPITGRIHTDYLNIGAATGRFSSRNPNLQNIPKDNEYRGGFIAEDGFSLITMDYSQQEFRLVGAVSGEEKILDAYRAGADMHIATAAIFYKKPLSEITKEERYFGKTLNFAILYGTTEWGLKRNLNISQEEAQEIITKFFEGYPKLSAFKAVAEERILALGYSVTPLGRRRYFEEKPVFATPNEIRMWEARIKREGFNHIIQGGGADITKLALNDMFYNNPFKDDFRLVLQEHDAIGAEAKDTILNDAVEFMKNSMINCFLPFLKGIPADVDYKIGKRWSK